MFCVESGRVVMTAGDYGVSLPLQIRRAGISGDFTMAFLVENAGGLPLVRKEQAFHGPVDEACITVELTAEESARLPVGRHVCRVELLVSGKVSNTVLGPMAFDVIGGKPFDG